MHRPTARARARRFALNATLFTLVVVVGLMATASRAMAHELDPFSVDRYVALLVGPEQLEIDYVAVLFEDATQDDGDRIEANPMAYCRELIDGVAVSVDTEAVRFDLATSTTSRRPGGAGLTTMFVECGAVAALANDEVNRVLRLDDSNYTGRSGWREIVVVGDRTEVVGDVLDRSPSRRLTDVPPIEENPDVSTVGIEFRTSDDVGPASLLTAVVGEPAERSGDPFTDLIAKADQGLVGGLVALGLAAFLGGLHSLAPGHGKTVIGAYLIGTRGTKVQAFILAIAVALSHTLGVLVLGILTYLAGAAFAPERVYPWLQALSAMIVLGIGVWLVAAAVGELRARRVETTRHLNHHDHCPIDRGHAESDQVGADRERGEMALAGQSAQRSAGTSTIAEARHVHGEPHDHDHDHDHHGHAHHGHAHDDHDHHNGWHRHGIFPHTHRYDLDELDLSGKVSWKTLALLGLSGGLVPSTSAIIVLLGAIQLNRIAFGGLLILAFGIGMSIALVSVGLGMVALRDRVFGAVHGNVLMHRIRLLLVPLAALAVLSVGVFLVVRAAAGIGAF
jgi:ABC-type nickel/cobalt efflux system permease component RcnA